MLKREQLSFHLLSQTGYISGSIHSCFFNQQKTEVARSLPTEAVTWSLHAKLDQINQILEKATWGKGTLCCQVFFFLLLVWGWQGMVIVSSFHLVFWKKFFSSQA